MKDSYLTAGIRFALFVRLLRRNRISFHPKKLVRLIFIFHSSLWASLFAAIEKSKVSRAINTYLPPADPIFIIGHWRTGSTLLHQLIACDPNLTAPTLFQVAQPEAFITAKRYFKPVFSLFVAKSRPMDNVALGMDEPQEDEYAIYRMTLDSPLEQLIFPHERTYFLNQVRDFVPNDKERDQWDEKVKFFFKKVAFSKSRQVVSKNPFHTFRIEALVKLFPDAKFIHIVRNPVDVVPSTIHMWKIVQRQNCLTNKEHTPDIGEICKFINLMDHEVSVKKTVFNDGRFAEIRYEDLEQNPLEEIRKLYLSLGLEMSQQFENNILNFCSRHIHFQKNTYTLTNEQREDIIFLMKDYMINHQYPA